jgi:hypothetical protein
MSHSHKIIVLILKFWCVTLCLVIFKASHSLNGVTMLKLSANILNVRSLATRPPLAGIIPVTMESLQRADFYPISLSPYTSVSLLWTLSAIGLLPHLLSPIPHWSAQVYLDHRLLYNLLSFCTRLTHHPDYGCSMHLWNGCQLQGDYTALHPEDSKLNIVKTNSGTCDVTYQIVLRDVLPRGSQNTVVCVTLVLKK